MTTADAHRTIETVWKIEAPRLIAGLARMLRDVGQAEDLAQEALVVALERMLSDSVTRTLSPMTNLFPDGGGESERRRNLPITQPEPSDVVTWSQVNPSATLALPITVPRVPYGSERTRLLPVPAPLRMRSPSRSATAM